MKRVFFLIILGCAAFRVAAQTFDFETSKFSDYLDIKTILTTTGTPTINVEHDKWSFMTTNSSWATNLKFKSLHDFVKVYIDYGNMDVVKNNYHYLITYTLHGYNNPSSPTTYTTISDTLSIAFNKDSLKAYQDKFYKKYSGFHKISIELGSVLKDTNNTFIPVDLNNVDGFNIRIEGEIWVQYYDKNYYGSSMSALVVSKNETTVATKRELDIKWNCSGCSGIIKPAMYELEWTFLDDYKYNLSTHTISSLTTSEINYQFVNNATRVITKDTFYHIPIIYDRGYLVYRVRMVRPDSVNYIAPVYGPWSIGNTGLISSLGSSNYYHNSTSFLKDSLNWQYTLSFAEDGKNKHAISYFDGLLHNKQSVTKVNSDTSNIIVTKSIEDFEGRPEIQILPIPVVEGKIDYVRNFAKNSVSGQYYRARDFDSITSGGSLCIPPALDSLASTSKAYPYYSTSNPDQDKYKGYIPDAHGYPMVQTILSPEDSKKPLTQGGVGKELQIGSTHETKYGYSGLMQPELNRLFGSEIGDETYYQKSRVRDANGQTSIQVNNNAGQVVYSSLVGTGPDSSLHPIIPMDLPSATTYKMNLITPAYEHFSNNSRIVNRQFSQDVTGSAPIDYSITFDPYEIGCANKYLSVESKYHYEILDECLDTVAHLEGTLGTNGVISSGAQVSYSAPTYTAYLNPETYTLNKVLTFDPQDVSDAVDSFIVHADTCLHDVNYFIRDEVQAKQFPCPVDTTTPCDVLKKEMMDELYPGHKYGVWIQNTDGTFNEPQSGNNNSIFTLYGTYCKNCTTYHYRYQDTCVHLPTSIIFNGTTYSGLGSLPQDQFISIFNDAIAESLLPQHPEYCRLQACYLQEDNYSDTLNAIQNTTEADNLDRLAIEDIANADPLILKGVDIDSLIQFNGRPNRIDSFAVLEALCGGITNQIIMTSQSEIYSSYITSSNPFPFLQTEPAVYEFYYGLMIQNYIANREKIKAEILLDTTNDCGPCKLVRMELIPDPIFPPALNVSMTSSYLDSINQILSNDTTYGNLSGLGIPDWMAQSLSNSTVSSTTQDSLLANYAASNQVFCEASVDAMMANFKNCTSNTTILDNIRDQLMDLKCTQGKKITFDDIADILSSVSIAQTDICNPYVLVDMEMPGLNFKSQEISCKSNAFYHDVKLFLSGSTIKTTFNTTSSTSTSYNLSPSNLFEYQLIQELGITSPYTTTVTNTYSSTEHQYKLEVAAGSSSVTIWFAYAKSNPTPIPISSITGWTIDDVQCLMDYAPITLPTHINLYTFVLKTSGSYSGSTIKKDFYSYNNAIQMLDPEDGSKKLDYDATACLELNRWYKEAKTTMDNLGILYGHQNYEKVLMNLIGAHNNGLYTYDDITEFAKSCALTDSTKQKVLTANLELECADSATATGVISDIYNYFGYMPTYLRYVKSSGKEALLIRFDDIDNDTTYLEVTSFINALSSTTVHLKSYGNDTLAMLFVPASSSYTITASDFATTTDVTITDASSTLGSGLNFYTGITMKSNYKLYAIKLNNTLQPYVLARYADSLRSVVHHQYPGAVFLPNYVGMMNEDYYLTEKQQWLQYNYLSGALRHDSVLLHLQVDSLLAGIASFSGKTVDYGDPENLVNSEDLYINDPSSYSSNTGYKMLNGFINCISDHLYALSAGYPSNAIAFDMDSIVISGTLLSSYNSQILNVGSNSSLKVFRCGSWKPGLYMIRYFDKYNKLYSAYYEVPNMLRDKKLLKRTVSNQLELGPGDGNTFRFAFNSIRYGYSGFTYKINGYTDFDLGNTLLLQKSILLPTALGDDYSYDTTSCERELIDQSIVDGKVRYQIYIDSVRNKMINDFMAYMITAVHEKLTITVKDLKYDFTLYYYDRAGNLCRTVPPEGVSHFDMADSTLMANMDTARVQHDNNTTYVSNHNKVSTYKYNSVNLLVEQSTPDGGTTHFWYDAVGRLVYSQNAKQALDNLFSYTLYDDQSRVIEVGQLELGPTDFTHVEDSHTYTLAQISTFILGKNRTQVCATLYDEEGYDLQNETGMSPQENLRKRVSASKYLPAVAGGILANTAMNYDFATYYSYDILGNVKTLTHDYKELLTGTQRFKRIDYDFDIYSGKVNAVSYNRGFADQFYQRYQYDKDNRLTLAETSKDGVYWDRDAGYDYYPHGPLARASLGDLNVQGVDYAYTIQGWLKAINGDVLDTLIDMGQDGKSNTAYLQDVFALTLDYFEGDYKSISGTEVSVLSAPSRSLYNGNIARQNAALKPFDALNKNYEYDPMNRIKTTEYNTIDWDNTNSSYMTTPTTEYAEKFDYDLDGNILRLLRKGNKVSNVVKTMDSLEYFYHTNGSTAYSSAQPASTGNRLKNVFDYANHSGVYSNDIPIYPGSTVTSSTVVSERFKYDAIGNLISDEMNGIDTIEWNLYGKVTDVTLPSYSDDHFTYDAVGNRISKTYSHTNDTHDTLWENRQIYVRDAQGNILAVYNDNRVSSVSPSSSTVPPWVGPVITAGLATLSNFQQAVITGFASNGNFQSSIINQASQNVVTFSTLFTATNFSTYSKNNKTFFYKALQFTNPAFKILNAVDSTFFSTALRNIDASNLSIFVSTIYDSHDASHFDTAMMTLARTDSYAYRSVFDNLEATYGPNDSINLNTLRTIAETDPGSLVRALTDVLSVDGEEETPPIRQLYAYNLSQTSTFDDEDWFYTLGRSIYVDAISRYTEEIGDDSYGELIDSLESFANNPSNGYDPLDSSWKATIKIVCAKDEIMAVNYLINPDTVANLLCANKGAADVLSTAIASIDEITEDFFWESLDSTTYANKGSVTVHYLIRRHYNLAEHHMYGSSRLGIKKYLPNHYEYDWDMNTSTPGIDSSSISFRQPWYNNRLADFVDIQYPEYSAYGQLDKSQWLSNRILGLKHYELTNHLGNVQSTVLDRYTSRLKNTTDTTYGIWRSDISSATDYYPFGSPMPGRDTHDTSTQWVTTTTPFTTQSEVVLDATEANTSHFTWTAFGPTSVTTFATSPDTVVLNNLGCPSSPVSLISDFGIRLKVDGLTSGIPHKIYIKYHATFAETFTFEQVTPISTVSVIAGPGVFGSNDNDVFVLPFTPTTSSEYFHFIYHAQCNYVVIDSVVLVKDTTLASYVSTTISNAGEKDYYRFGFNGQEKVNEIAGIGNHNTAMFWEYDTRLGRRWNLDPKPNVGLSQYSAFANNPILFSDVLGDTTGGNGGGFGTIGYENLRKSIDARIANPKFINQKNTGLCGTACVAFLLAQHQPMEYNRIITDLWANGFSHSYANGYSLYNINTDPDRHLQSKLQEQTGMDPADYVLLTSLRDNLNNVLDYDTRSGSGKLDKLVEGASAFTMPNDMETLSKNILGLKDINDNTNLVFSKFGGAVSNVLEIDKAYNKSGGVVFMLINSSMLENKVDKISSPNHWVVYQGGLTIDEKNSTVTFNVFSWGENKAYTINFSTFTDNYYGTITAHW